MPMTVLILHQPPTAERIVRFESLINIRPRQNNFGLEVQGLDRRIRIEQIVRNVFEGQALS